VARITPFWRDVWEAGIPAWSIHAGQYVMTPDRRPLVGSTGVDGLWVNAGHGGRGVMSAPATGRILVDLMTGLMRADENPYAPDRTFDVPAPAEAL
jgi:glycine/D-amino acid oxidase-like deaminating enzyme